MSIPDPWEEEGIMSKQISTISTNGADDDAPVFKTGGSPKFEEGIYKMLLSKVEKGTKKIYDFDKKLMTEDMEDCVNFVFIDPDTNKELLRQERAIVVPKSGLVKFAKMLGGNLFTETVLNEPKEKFWPVLKSLAGKSYMVSIQNKQSSTGGSYSNIVTVMPLPK